MVQLFGDEELHRLYAKGSAKIIQSPSVFSFSLDAVLLANHARPPKNKKRKILDLCSGNGVIPLLLAKQTKVEIIGMEIQEKLVDMARRSVAYNHLADQIQIFHGDLKERYDQLKHSSFDLVTCNPPYFRIGSSKELNLKEPLAIARHELLCTLEDVVRACKFYVKPGGRVVMVYRPDRLVELLHLLSQFNLEPKRIRFIYPKAGKDANMVIVESVRDGKPGVRIIDPLTIYQEGQTYTEEAEAIMNGRE